MSRGVVLFKHEVVSGLNLFDSGLGKHANILEDVEGGNELIRVQSPVLVFVDLVPDLLDSLSHLLNGLLVSKDLVGLLDSDSAITVQVMDTELSEDFVRSHLVEEINS